MTNITKKGIMTMAAKLIVSEICSMLCDLETYPTISDMHASDTTPPLLHLLLRNMIISQLKHFVIVQCIFFCKPQDQELS